MTRLLALSSSPPNLERDAAYPLLTEIIGQEGSDFQRIENRWRPKNLLLLPQVRLLLRDVDRRFDQLSTAEPELETLDRANIYITLVRRMRIWVRQASFTWKSDQLQFLQAVGSFYKDYGNVLRLLKFDAQRGRLANPSS
jgi:hypothetical protein